MINHARTLLANRNAGYFADVPGAEYIPTDFQPVELTDTLKAVRDLLLPPGLDKFGENYLVSAVTHLIHAPDLLPYVELLDPRFTYTDSTEILARTTDKPIVKTSAQDAACNLTPNYKLYPSKYPTDFGLAGNHAWTITRTDAERLRVEYSRGPERIIVVTNGTRRTTTVALIPGYLEFYLTAPTTHLTGKFRYTCSTTLAVPYSVGEVQYDLEQYMARPGFREQVFAGVPGYETRISELMNVWQYSVEAPLRVGAVALAVIYQAEGLRVRRG